MPSTLLILGLGSQGCLWSSMAFNVANNDRSVMIKQRSMALKSNTSAQLRGYERVTDLTNGMLLIGEINQVNVLHPL